MKNILYTFLVLLLVSNTNAQVYPYNQDFENYASFSPPSDWTYTTAPFNVYPTRGVNGSKGLTRNFFSLSLKDSIISPLIGTITPASALMFEYRIVDYIGSTPLAHTLSAGDKIEIKVLDGVNPPVTLLTIDTTNHIDSSGFQPITASLSAFSGDISIMISVTSGGGDFFVDLDNFVVDELLGLQPLAKKELFSIFPNPASGSLKFNSNETGSVIIYDYEGNIVLKDDLTTVDQMIDISALSNGVFLVEFASKSGLKASKTLNVLR